MEAHGGSPGVAGSLVWRLGAESTDKRKSAAIGEHPTKITKAIERGEAATPSDL
jgi:hypothetical protein